jgi:AcrR family transcriptional regulator
MDKNPKKPTRRQEQILNAALEVFARKGYAAATVPEIAQAAGVAIGTIYIYYPSKRELFLAVIRNLLITVPLLNLFQKMSADQFPVIFKSIIQNRLSFIEGGNTARLLSLMGEIQRDPELKAMYLEQLIQPIMSRMEAFYRAQIESGRFRQFDPAVVVRAIGGMIIGLAILRVLEGANSPLERLPQGKLADDLLNLVFYGLSNEDRTTGAKQEKPV